MLFYHCFYYLQELFYTYNASSINYYTMKLIQIHIVTTFKHKKVPNFIISYKLQLQSTKYKVYVPK